MQEQEKSKSKKNKITAVLLVVLIIMLIIIGDLLFYIARIEKERTVPSGTTEAIVNKIDNPTNEIKISEAAQNADRIYKDKELVYTEEEYNPDNKIDNKYIISQVPAINLSFDNIKKLNNEIYEYFTKLKSKNVIEKDGEYVKYQINTMRYEYFINEKILSLVISCNIEDSVTKHTTTYITYNINIETGELITNEQLIATLNHTNSEVYNEILNEISIQYKEIYGADVTKLDNTQNLYNDTIKQIGSELKINLPMYMNSAGKLMVCIDIVTDIGAGQTSESLELF